MARPSLGTGTLALSPPPNRRVVTPGDNGTDAATPGPGLGALLSRSSKEAPEGMPWTLALSGIVSLAAATCFGLTAAWFARGRPAGLERAAWIAARSFAWWWGGLGVYTAMQGVMDLLGAEGYTPLPLFVFARLASLPVFCFALYGLVDHAIYLRTGTPKHRVFVAAYFSAFALGIVALILRAMPVGVVVMRWRTDVQYPVSASSPAVGIALALIALPSLFAVGSQLLLARRIQDPARRRRVVVVFGALATYLVAMALSRYSENDAWQLAMRPLLGLVTAGVVVWAYKPPRERPARSPARAALEARVRDLV